jgi:hypothetical protein
VQIFLEDAGFDWKILGPDVSSVDYVAWQCDQDAYACSGQKCSAQSLLFMHKNWAQAGTPPSLANIPHMQVASSQFPGLREFALKSKIRANSGYWRV